MRKSNLCMLGNALMVPLLVLVCFLFGGPSKEQEEAKSYVESQMIEIKTIASRELNLDYKSPKELDRKLKLCYDDSHWPIEIYVIVDGERTEVSSNVKVKIRELVNSPEWKSWQGYIDSK